jgi:excisionase family DNA binding protein
MTTDQVAAEFGYNRETVRRWIREGRVAGRRDAGGRKLWIRRSDFASAAGRADGGLSDRGPTAESGSRIAGEPVTIAVPGDRTRLVAN